MNMSYCWGVAVGAFIAAGPVEGTSTALIHGAWLGIASYGLWQTCRGIRWLWQRAPHYRVRVVRVDR